MQTGFLYSYAFWMVIGLALLLGWFLRNLLPLELIPGRVMSWPILSVLVWLPILGGLLVMSLGERRTGLARWLALSVSVVVLVLSIGCTASSMAAPPTSSSWSACRGSRRSMPTTTSAWTASRCR